MKIVPINQLGSAREATLLVSYQSIVERIGEPNTTHLDDPYKVKASWGFMDAQSGRKGFIWCYKYDDPSTCKNWSVAGDMSLILDIFQGCTDCAVFLVAHPLSGSAAIEGCDVATHNSLSDTVKRLEAMQRDPGETVTFLEFDVDE